MFARSLTKELFMTLNTAGTVTGEFYFPKAARIKSYYAVPSVAQAAHATIVDKVIFTDRGTAGAGSTVLATLTNDSDIAETTLIRSAAWVAHDAIALNTEDRPGAFSNTTDVADEIAAGGVISVALTGEGTTPTPNTFTVGIEFWESD